MEPSAPAEDREPTAGQRRGLWAVLLIAALVRGLYLLEQPTFPEFHQPEVDAWYYHVAAQRIAGGDWLLGREPLRMSPSYFYFLGSVYSLFGDGPWAPRLLQTLLGIGLVALLWDATRRFLGARWAAWPALAAALYGPLIYFEGHLLSDSLGAFLHMLLLWLLVRALERKALSARSWLAIGVAWGACAITRPNALLLALPALYALAHLARAVSASSTRGAWLAARPALLGFALGGALAILPVTTRNLIASGQPVLLTAHGGVNLYVGNGPGATGTFRTPREVPGAHSPMEQFEAFHAQAERALGRELSAREADSYWMQRTVQAALDHPGQWLAIMVRKLHLFWNGRELHNVYDYEFARVIGGVLGAPLVQFAYVAPFALLGVLALALSPGSGRMLSLFVLSVCAGVVVVFVTDRYRLPVVGPALLCGAGLVRALVGAWRARARAQLAVAAVLFAAACAIAVPVKVNKRMHEKYFKYANAWLEIGELGYAEWGFQRSLAADPRFLPSHRKLVELYARAGERAQLHAAAQAWERAARTSGDAAQAQQARAVAERSAATAP